MPPIIRLLRPHQYAKNLLVFAAAGAAGRFDEFDVLASTLLAFVLFCAVSSAGYVVNDLCDVEADRKHPTKKDRPIASGQVSPRQALAAFFLLAIGALALSLLLGATFILILAGYGAVSTTYSFKFKQVPWLELLFVSAGFVLRSVGGGAATDTPVSLWFLLVVSAGALLVITGKRLGELASLGSRTASRKVLAGYKQSQLQLAATIASSVAVGGYIFWAAAEARDQVTGSTGSILLALTAVPFAIAIARYLVLSWHGEGETPESLIVRDRIMLIAGASWVIAYAAGLYL